MSNSSLMNGERCETADIIMDEDDLTRETQPRQEVPEHSDKTWKFVQMNMSLLPIARPLPVNVTTHRVHEGAVAFGSYGKPSTPNQKLHQRVLEQASNISPRHNELDTPPLPRNSRSHMLPLSEFTSISSTIHDAPTPCTSPQSSTSLSSPCPSPFRVRDVTSPSFGSRSPPIGTRMRSVSADFLASKPEIFTLDGGYASDSDPKCLNGVGMVMHRNGTQHPTASQTQRVIGKRILELQDEERWLNPEAPPAKRGRFE